MTQVYPPPPFLQEKAQVFVLGPDIVVEDQTAQNGEGVGGQNSAKWGRCWWNKQCKMVKILEDKTAQNDEDGGEPDSAE